MSLRRICEEGAGAVTTKSIGPEPRTGHPNPTVLEWEHGLINAVGLSNAGVEEMIGEVKEAMALCKSPVIASFFAGTSKEFGEVAGKLSQASPGIIEANISCPNVASDFGTPFAYTPESAGDVVSAIKESTSIPLIVKLSPNTFMLKQVAKAVEEAGADAINMGNTLGPGMIINPEAGKPVLANVVGGLSGPAVKPVAVRCVWDVYSSVEIPVIGTGGVLTGRDAVEMMMAGATAVGIGSAIKYRDLECFRLIPREISEWMKENGYSKLSDLVGAAHG